MINKNILSNIETKISSLMGKAYSIINCWDFLLENKEVKRFSMVDIKDSMNENLYSYRKELIKIKNDMNEYFVNNMNMFEPEPTIASKQKLLTHKINEALKEIEKELNKKDA